MESSVLSSGERRSGKEAAVKQSIIQLILKWKLNSAEVEIQKNENVLSEKEINHLCYNEDVLGGRTDQGYRCVLPLNSRRGVAARNEGMPGPCDVVQRGRTEQTKGQQ